MLAIDLKQLRENVGPAVEFLRSRLEEPVKVKGRLVMVTGTSARRAKLLFHKFLHQHQLEGYRVLVVNRGLIEVRAPEKRRERPIVLGEGTVPQPGRLFPTSGTLLHRDRQASEEK